VPVIDIFAGPGGLGEGFSAFQHEQLRFDVVLSVEKDIAAYRTLMLIIAADQHSGAKERHLEIWERFIQSPSQSSRTS
jgi:site-specific DNA-cytosine methylase